MTEREVRLAELVALLSLGTDLGLGQPMEHMIRACLIALRLAEHLGIEEQQRADLYYSGLLAWVGCHTDAYEQAKWLGDDTVLKRDAHYGYDMGKAGPAAAFMFKHIGGLGRPLLERVRIGVGFVGDGRRALEAMAENHYLATDELAARLGMRAEVRESLRQNYERWDGKGAYRLAGDQVDLGSRLINLADVVEVFRRSGGVDAAIDVARERSGGQLDPDLVDLFCAHAEAIFAGLDDATSWDLVIEAEPALGPKLSPEQLDAALDAVGEFAELKSPWRIGHARVVADLAAAAGRAVGFPDADLRHLRRAALVVDIGHLGVANTIWDKTSPLSPSERERVRLHPYIGERMLAFSPALRPLGATIALHHERLDGSGYPKAMSGDAIPPVAKVLGAADVYQALVEPRPHRPARSPDEAAAELRSEVKAGRLDAGSAEAVLAAAGHRVPRRREWPSGLTAREVEVLRLVARGMSNKQIAAELFISAKTAGTHVEHIYSKIGVSNRAQAGLYAMKHGLMFALETSGEHPM